MGVKRRQGSGDQPDLFDQALQASLRLGATGEGGTGPGACAEPQALAVLEQQRALTRDVDGGGREFSEPQPGLQAGQSEQGRRRRGCDVHRRTASLAQGEPREADRLADRRQLPTANRAGGGNPQARRRESANSASRPWWTVSFSKRSCKSWSRSSIQRFRRRASVSALGAAPIKRSPKPKATSPTGARSSSILTWKNSWMSFHNAPRVFTWCGQG